MVNWRKSSLAHLKAAAAAFRVGMDAQGNNSLAEFIDALDCGLNRGELQAFSTRLFPFLTELLAAQDRGDTLFAADLLEYEIGPLLLEDQSCESLHGN
jgi:hypothetical protein